MKPPMTVINRAAKLKTDNEDATEGSGRATEADGVLSGGGAFGERKPGGRGNVPDAADLDGADKGS